MWKLVESTDHVKDRIFVVDKGINPPASFPDSSAPIDFLQIQYMSWYDAGIVLLATVAYVNGACSRTINRNSSEIFARASELRLLFQFYLQCIECQTKLGSNAHSPFLSQTHLSAWLTFQLYIFVIKWFVLTIIHHEHRETFVFPKTYLWYIKQAAVVIYGGLWWIIMDVC